MSLPDASRLLEYPSSSWRALAKRLRDLGLTPARVAPIVSAVRGLHPSLRGPARAYHLRKLDNPAGHAMRMFLFADPVTDEQARKTLGDELDALLATGLLARREDGSVVSPFVMSLFNQLLLLSDDLTHGDAGVMGFGEGTIELCRVAFPGSMRKTALDLGCGAGTCALVLAAGVKRVVATDINPRAMLLARANLLLNSVDNVELREGDSFAPVAGERFDIVASQPPFVPLPEGSARATFLHGGRRGDEMALRVLGEIAAHLTPDGRAVLRVDWPEDGAPLGDRLRAAAGDSVDLLVLKAPEVDADDHATAYAAGMFPALGPSYAAEVSRRLAHLTATKIRGFSPSIVAVQPKKNAEASTDVVPIAPLSRAPVTSDRIDKLFAARALVKNRDKLLKSPLSVPQGTVLAQEQKGIGEAAECRIFARFADEAARPPLEISPEQLFLATFVHESKDVKTAVARFARETQADPAEAMEQCLPVVEGALIDGLLQVRG